MGCWDGEFGEFGKEGDGVDEEQEQAVYVLEMAFF